MLHSLERRLLLAVTIDGATIRIDTTSGNDVVSVTKVGGYVQTLQGRRDEGSLVINENGAVTILKLRDGTRFLYDRMLVNLGNGNDGLTVHESIYMPAAAYGERGDDTLTGGLGGDWLNGGGGADRLEGRGGANDLIGGAGPDVFVPGSGIDNANYYHATARVVVTTDGRANDGLPGERDNVLVGIDKLTGGSGDDLLVADQPYSGLYGGPGNDALRGGAGTQGFYGGPGNDSLAGLAGNDYLSGEDGRDLLDGGDGDDHMGGGYGTDRYRGGAGRDSVGYGIQSQPNVNDLTPVFASLDGLANDGRPGENENVPDDIEILSGGAGDDTIVGNDADNELDGGGYEGNDLVRGGGGNDTIRGVYGNDTLYGDAGDDWLRGDQGHDVLDGGDGDDSLEGSWDNDLLLGGLGIDTLHGSWGRDTLDGGGQDEDVLDHGPD